MGEPPALSLAEMDDEKETVQRKVYVPFWTDRTRCYESALVDEEEAFIYFDADTGRYDFTDKLDGGNAVLVPYEAAEQKYGFSSIELREASTPAFGDLYQDIYRIEDDYWAHLDGRVKKFNALYIIHSYLLTRSLGTVFVWLVGGRRAGKSTQQMIAEKLGYRAFSGVGPSEAAIYRTLGHDVEYGPLIVVKEYERASELMKVLAREGDVPGSTVPRSDKENDNFIVNQYHLYGSRFVGSNSLHGNEADMDRYFVEKCLHLRPKRPRAELYRNKEVANRLEKLRKSLLLWKLAALHSLEFPFEDPKGEIPEGRDWEHFGGVITLASRISSELEGEIRSLVVEYLKETIEEAKSNAAPILLDIVQGLANSERLEGKVYRIPFEDIWKQVRRQCAPLVENGVEIPTKVILADGTVLTTTRAGKVLKEQLLGKPDRWWEGGSEGRAVRGYAWTRESLRALEGSLTGLTSLTGLEKSETALVEQILEGDTGKVTTVASPEPVRLVQPVMSVPRPELVDETREAKGKRWVHCRIHDSWHRTPEVWERHLSGDHEESIL